MKDKLTKKPPYKGDEEKQQIRALKRRIKNLERDNAKLKSENKQLQKAWKKTQEFLSSKTDENTLNELIEAAKKGQLRTDKPQKKEFDREEFVRKHRPVRTEDEDGPA